MAREIEAKFRVNSHEPVRRLLRESGAVFVGRVLETNRIFDRAAGSLRAAGCGLRVRAASPVSPVGEWPARPPQPAGPTPGTMTFKGPVEPGPYKLRPEIELEISNVQAAADMLAALGFVEILCYQKRRETWRLNDCTVELDEPPHIGLFVEIEGPDEAAIDDVRNILGLSCAEPIRSSYVRLLSDYCTAHGLRERTLLLQSDLGRGRPG